MFYIVDDFDRYFAGLCDSNNKTPIWKNCHTRAIPFVDMQSAISYTKERNIKFLGVEYIVED